MGMQIEGRTVNIADIAGMDMGEIEAREFMERFPKAVYQFIGRGGELTSFGSGDDERAVVRFIFEVENVDNVQDFKTANGEDRDASVLIGKEYTETCFLDGSTRAKFVESLGYVKQLVIMITGKPEEEVKGDVHDIINMTDGCRFQVPVIHRPNKNDKDNPYVNLDRPKIVAVAAVPPSAEAA